VTSVAVVDGTLVTAAATRAGPAPCTGCARLSDWLHSAYVRHVFDEAVGGRPVRIDLTVRRLYCENPHCPKRTFAEQVPGLTRRYQRRAPAWQQVVDAVALALAGRAGSRLPEAALTLPYHNGRTEGVNQKLLKRQTYGRASFPLLRQRILLS
jgi:transposase